MYFGTRERIPNWHRWIHGTLVCVAVCILYYVIQQHGGSKSYCVRCARHT